MLLVVKIDVNAWAGTKMRMRAFCAPIEPYRCPSLAVSTAPHTLHRPCVRACALARYLDDLNVQVLDGWSEDPVVFCALTCSTV